MSAKKLDQSVFDGLLSEYRWAVIDHCGEVFVLSGEKPELNKQKNDWHFYGRDYSLVSCKYGDATDWQNSLIERQDVPTAADIDWSRQDVPAGATHYQPECEATNNGGRYFKDGFKSVFEPEMHAAWLAVSKSIDLTGVIEIPTKPEPQVDWSAAPEGATHWHKDEFVRWTGKRNPVFGSWDMDGWIGGVWALAHWGWQGTLETFLEDGAIPRPESITDVARSIEAARIEEQACMPWPDGDARYFEISPVGQKHDASKPRYSLLPTGSVERVIDVLEFGATKYAPNNWRHVSDARTRYYDATMRHLSAWWQGEKYDAESGLHHLAHAACCILFLLWFERSAK